MTVLSLSALAEKEAARRPAPNARPSSVFFLNARKARTLALIAHVQAHHDRCEAAAQEWCETFTDEFFATGGLL